MFWFFPASLISSTYKEKNDAFSVCTKKKFSIGNLLPTVFQKDFLKLPFPSVLPEDDRTDSAQEERLDLPYWTMILAICVVVDESKCLNIWFLEFPIICEPLPFLLGYKLILRLLLVHRNQAIWR